MYFRLLSHLLGICRNTVSITAATRAPGSRLPLKGSYDREHQPQQSPLFLFYACVATVLATLSGSVMASPPSITPFDKLALSCAPGIEPRTLHAVAAIESHFEPLAIRDNTTRESMFPPRLSAAVSLAKHRMRMGHSIDIGLMQINSSNLATLGMTIDDALNPCRSLQASAHILADAYSQGPEVVDRQAALLIALSRYNTGRPLAGIANGYANRVMGAEGAMDTALSQTQSEPASPWDIWGSNHAAPSSWVLTANGSSDFVRAGAQTSDARREGRAPAILSEKGEPYELSAYRESEEARR